MNSRYDIPSRLHDQDLGWFSLRLNPRAKRYIIRIDKHGEWLMTVPPMQTKADVVRTIDKMREDLRKHRARLEHKLPHHIFDTTTYIHTPTFRMRLERGKTDGIKGSIKVEGGVGHLSVYVDERVDITSRGAQDAIERLCVQGLRFTAQRILPPRLMTLAKQYGLSINKVGIHNTTSRWGSRSSKGNINLSLYLVLLPHHLQDHVMKHELTHILHMDHSEAFWNQLDILCQGRAKEEDKEMSNYRINLRHYLRECSE